MKDLAEAKARMSHKFTLDTERLRSELAAATLEQEYATSKFEKAARERNRAIDVSSKANRALDSCTNQLANTERKSEEQLTETLLKSKNQMKVIREEFEQERNDYRTEIDALRKGKVDLQAEIGQLLRDRRINNVSYGN